MVSMILDIVICSYSGKRYQTFFFKEISNMFIRNSHFISATQNGKLPPLPRCLENNGIVSTFIYLFISG